MTRRATTTAGGPRGASDAHRHYDVAIAGGLVGQGAELAGGLLVFEFEGDRAVGSSGEEMEQVLASRHGNFKLPTG